MNTIEAEETAGFVQVAVGVEVLQAAALFQAHGFDPVRVRLFVYKGLVGDVEAASGQPFDGPAVEIGQNEGYGAGCYR